MLFRRGEPPETLKPARPIHLAVGYSLVPSSTKAMVDRVAETLAASPATVAVTFREIDGLVGLARLALESDDARGLGALMNQNHEHLRRLGVSTPILDGMCAAARARGALGAKLTGAGGGGCVIALASTEDEAHAVLNGWLVDGYSGFVARRGGGVFLRRERAS